MRSATHKGFTDFAENRAVRLLAPWAIWSIIYACLKFGDAGLNNQPISSEFSLYMLVTGPALHLWFLPFAFVISLAIYPLASLQTVATGALRWGLLALFTGAALIGLYLVERPSLGVPVEQWLYGMPAALLGIALAFGLGSVSLQVTVLVGITAAAIYLGWTDDLLQLVLAGVVLLVALNVPIRASRLSAGLSRTSLNIYLGHPVFLSLLDRFTALPERSWLLVVLASLGAALLGGGIDRILGRAPPKS